ncbi:MAG: fasciclin domain-containing protein, partial [Chloroflexota bacterium]
FAAALEALGLTAEELLADTDTLTTVLLYHVVAGNVTSSDIVDGAEVETVQGETILTEIVDGGVVLNGAVNVIAADITASNGVIHVIDGVLLPPSLVEALSAPAEEPQQEAAEEEAPAEETAEEPAEQFTGQTFLRLAHLAGDIGGADIYINGQLRRPFTDVQQGTVTGFFALPEGNYRIQVVPTGRNTGRAVIDAELFLGDGEYNTVAAYGNAFSTGIDAAVIPEDRESTLSATGARVTVFHAIEDAPAVDVLAGGNPLITLLGYPGTLNGNDGAFTVEVPADTYDITVVPSGASEPVVLDLSGTTIEAGNAYFVAAIGSLADPAVSLSVVDITPPGTIVDVAAADENFSTLVTILTEAAPDFVTALSDPNASYTVFAPTNAAFESLLADLGITVEQALAVPEVLQTILAYHVVEGAVPAETVLGLDGQEVATLQGEAISVNVIGRRAVRLNGNVAVTATDVMASNGVIHVIDNVLLPQAAIDALTAAGVIGGEEEAEAAEAAPTEAAARVSPEEISAAAERLLGLGADEEEAEEMGEGEAAEEASEEMDMQVGTIVDVAAADENFSTLVTILTEAAPDFVTALSDPNASYTVFAPTNAAFESLLADLGITVEQALAVPEVLQTILAYHVVEGAVPAETVLGLDGQEVATLQGEAISVNVIGRRAVRLNGNVAVTATDVMASNGVIHVIDNVLLPQAAIDALTAAGVIGGEEEAEAAEAAPTEAAARVSPEEISAAAERLLGLGADEEEAEEMGEGEADMAEASDLTIAEIAASDENFSTLVLILTEAAPDYAAALSDPEAEFTVFAPTNAAFDALSSDLGIVIEDAIAFPDILIDILGYHVVEGFVDAEGVLSLDGGEVPTIQGEPIAVSVVQGGVVLDGIANVTATDIVASNGIIHVIDQVLLPQSTIDTLASLGLTIDR